jgi:fatty-acyl-CoA synthase
VEAVTAVIVPKPGSTVKEEEILKLCRQDLADFKVPKHVVFVDELPRSSSGKILKRELRKRL